MTLVEAVKHVFNNYANFNGRARRSEYWYFVVFNILVNIALTVIGGILGALAGEDAGSLISSGLSGIYSLAILVPSLAVGCRRLHDTGRSGWLLLLSLIPLVGFIILLVFECQDSQPGENQYGPNPKEYPNAYY